MDSENVVCPVCTLFLRPGITLKSHLASHPKQKVIEALVRLSNPENIPKLSQTPSSHNENVLPSSSNSSNSQIWNQPMPVASNFGGLPGNHSFIYQQFMSSTAPQPNVLNVNPLAPQVVTIPTVFNSQMMCPPYVYQQQQVIMSTGPSVMPVVPRPLPIELPQSPESDLHSHSQQGSPVLIENEDENCRDEPDLVTIELHSPDVQEDETCIKSSNSVTQSDQNNLDREEQNDSKVVCEEPGITEIKTDILEIKKQDLTNCNDKNNQGVEVNTQEYNEHDCSVESPQSNNVQWNIKINNDLDKSCQTQIINSYNEIQDIGNMETASHEIECKSDCYYTPEIQENVATGDYAILQNSFSQNEPTYAIENQTENIYTAHTQEQGNLIDMDGMNLLISNDFLNNQLVSQVEDFDCVSSERPRVLMNIGGIETNFADHREAADEMSRESANIRADEHMPPRGELSGQESNGGTSDMNWNHVQYQEGSCAMPVNSYDLIARETWEGSDISDADAPPIQNHNSNQYLPYDNDDTPTVSGYREPPITYKCSTCGESFNCPKERRVHQKRHHDKGVDKLKSSDVIASQAGAKKVKKLTIKPKRSEVKSENNFDNVFTNKLKIEPTGEADNFDRVSVILPPNSTQLEIEKTEELLVNNPIICTICDVVVSDNNALKQHQLDVHKFSSDIRHKCGTCNETFPNEVKYTEHLKVHPLECRLCGKYFYRRQNMQLHMKRHLGIKPYKCNICEKAFLTKQKHDEHKNIHTGDAPIKCNFCDETFRRHSNLVQHRNRHHFKLKKKLKDYVCFCGEIFHSKKKLAWHKEIHDAKPKACSQCSEKFIHMSSLTRHVRRAHNERFVPKEERNTENVECPVCKGIYLRSSLDVHIRNHSGQRPYTCLICSKDFTTKWNLKLHKWTHASRTSKPYKCDQCKGAFIRESDFIAHMNSHKSVKPYTCNYCGAQFIRKYNCQRHVKEHEKIKNFSCQICGKTFHRSYYLKDHMRVHSGVRPYTCHICGKTSTTKSNHNKHVRIHHAREPVSTEN